VADLRHVYATTIRDRHMVKRVVTPRFAATEMRQHIAAGEGCGVLFGPERAGLINDHVSLAETILSVPLNPAFSSLNLAQAVLVVAYEWFTAADQTPPVQLDTAHSIPAPKEALIHFFAHLEEELDRSGFMRDPDKRPTMVRNLRNIFQRAQLTEQEVRTLHGVVTSFAGQRRRRDPSGAS
jgi:tRNA/rRNA methyltransferase